MKQKRVAIQLKRVTKRYVVHHEKPTFVESVISRGYREEFTALNDVSLTIYKGEKVGIIGRNGAGKTTLLKLMAGIATPTSGSVKTHGRIVSLIDLEAGFHPDLTGEENIFLNGLVLGMTKAEITKQYKSIVAYADIGRFIDAPLFAYSQGMKLRLGFAVAVHAQPDILILDEGTGSSDQFFWEKMAKKYREFAHTDITVLSASHWAFFLESIAHIKRCILLDQAKITKDGSISVLKQYASSTT